MRLKILLVVMGVIGVLLLAGQVESPSPAPILLSNATDISCLEKGATATCNVSEVNASDGVYANGTGLDSSSGNLAQVITNHTEGVPDGSTIVNVTLSVEWAITGGGSDTCSIEVFNGTWNNLTITGCPGGTDNTTTFNISDIVTNETLAEDVRVRINYTRSTTNRLLKVDLVNVTITYLPPRRWLEWNLTYENGSVIVSDGVNFSRNDTINVTALWDFAGFNTTGVYIEHNGSGANTNYSLTDVDTVTNWTNFTLTLSNSTHFPTAGNVTVVAIHAEDVHGQINMTTPVHYFSLIGFANVTNVTFDSNSILNGTNATLYCNVTDGNSSAGITDYNASFYQNDSFLGSNITNSSGIATFLYEDSTNINMTSLASQTLSIKCNITANVSLYYDFLGTREGNRTLNIVAMGSVNLTENHSIYNRGENLTLAIHDTNNNSISNITWIVNLTKYQENESTLYNLSNDTFRFNISPTDPVGNYTLLVNGTKQDHSIQQTFRFNVSSTLTPVFDIPAADTGFSAGASLTGVNLPEVRIENARGENITYNVSVTLTCPNQDIVLEKVGDVYKNTSSVETCNAHTSSGTTFNITANITNDSNNNTGLGNLSLQTSAASSATGSGGGGSGGGGGSVCECEEWVSVACGVSNCSNSELYQTRVCNPAGCREENQCVEHPVCEADFSFSVNPVNLTVDQGMNGTVIGTVSNPTEFSLAATVGVDKECCDVSTVPGFVLGPREVREFPFLIHVPLNQAAGEYIITGTVSAKIIDIILEKTRQIRLEVMQNPLISDLELLEDRLEELTERIEEYASSGIDSGELVEEAGSIRAALEAAARSVGADDVRELENRVLFAEERLELAEEKLDGLTTVKLFADNQWNIGGGAVVVIILTYLISQVFLPSYRLGKEAIRLSKEEKMLVKTRVETQKQYFSRKIDEKTFNKLMIETQGKVHRARSGLKGVVEEREMILKTKLKPQALGMWVKRGVLGSGDMVKRKFLSARGGVEGHTGLRAVLKRIRSLRRERKYSYGKN